MQWGGVRQQSEGWTPHTHTQRHASQQPCCPLTQHRCCGHRSWQARQEHLPHCSQLAQQRCGCGGSVAPLLRVQPLLHCLACAQQQCLRLPRCLNWCATSRTSVPLVACLLAQCFLLCSATRRASPAHSTHVTAPGRLAPPGAVSQTAGHSCSASAWGATLTLGASS